MKERITSILKALVLLCAFPLMSAAQAEPVIEGNKLISWPGASGYIKIPDKVTEIAENCFHTPAQPDPEGWGETPAISNTAITAVNLNDVEIVGKNAFKDCTGIISINAPRLQVVGETAFEGCSSLKELFLVVTRELGKKAFANCESLHSVELGKQLATVTEGNPFPNCPTLKRLTVNSQNEAFFAESNALVRKSDGALLAVAGMQQELALDGRILAIEDAAFFGCQKLLKLSLPECKTIGAMAFTNCRLLGEISLPKLQNVSDNFLTFSGLSALKVFDIHQSERFASFHHNLTDVQSLTIYVANEAVKTRLQGEFKKAKLIVGPPNVLDQYEVKYSTNAQGALEVWTTGGVDVLSGSKLGAGAKVFFKAIPRFDHEIDTWVLNGKPITEGLNKERNIYTIDSLAHNVELQVTFRKRPEGCMVFFRSLSPAFGSISCKLDDGTEVKSSQKVPIGAMLHFTAMPRRGYRVTDWSKEETVNNTSQFVVIAGTNGKPTYSCKAEDGMDIAVNFDRLEGYHIVKFRSLNTGNATLEGALADGTKLISGEAWPKKSKVTFTALPIGENKVVESWLVDEKVVEGATGFTFTVESLERDLEVWVLCVEKKEPEENLPVIKEGRLISWKPVGKAILPDEVTYIESRAFEGAARMTSLTLNKRLAGIGERAFLYTSELTEFVSPAENKHFVAEGGVLFNKEKSRIVAYPAARPDKLYALAATVKSIVPGCFATCPNLLGLTLAEGNTAFKAVNGALYTAEGSTLLYFPSGFATEMQYREVVLPEGTKSIARLALAYSPALKTLQLPSSLTTIESLALSNNPGLEKLLFANPSQVGITEIADSAFFYNRKLAELPYMPSLKHIGRNAFGTCTALEQLHLPKGCVVDKDAFRNCLAVKRLYAHSSTPIPIDAEQFKDIVYIREATLFVPPGAKEHYRKATGWSIFTKIEEDSTLGSQLASASAVTIQRTAEGFWLQGLPTGVAYRLFTVEGILLERGILPKGALFVATHGAVVLLLEVEGSPAIKLK